METRLSRFAKRLMLTTAICTAMAACACLLILKRSQNAMAAAGSPVNIPFNQPSTIPFVQAYSRTPTTGPTVRVAVIGGMFFTGFWNALAERYEQQTGVRVELIATGPKNDIVAIFKKGQVDLITMHASDTMVNLSVNGFTLDPQPWLRNDLAIVGPPEDPAGIKGMSDAAAALKKIAAARSAFVVHSSLGAQEVLLNILEPNQIRLDPANTTVLFDDQQRSVLKVAGEKHAYTLVGRIPFRTGRLPNNGLVMMVQGDERLMRPYLVAVTNPKWMAAAHFKEAKKFAVYLRKPETQQWIAGYGRGTIDERPIFFPVTLPDMIQPHAPAGN
jgi:tungstate transport system substrate-binding protein